MKDQNICKFPSSALSDSLSIHCFVYESNPANFHHAHSLRYHRILLATQGQGAFTVHRELKVPFQAGTLIFAFEGELLELTEEKDSAFLYVDFGGRRAEELFRRFGIGKSKRCFEGLGGMIPLWRENLSRASRDTIDLAAESVLLHTLSRLGALEAEQNGTVTEILRITEGNFKDPDLCLSSLAEQMTYHPKYLSHLFKKEMGVGYSEYLRDLRINYARSLFDHGLDSVKNVALLSGFVDPLYFSGVFKKVIGVSPKEYIQESHAKQPEETP